MIVNRFTVTSAPLVQTQKYVQTVQFVVLTNAELNLKYRQLKLWDGFGFSFGRSTNSRTAQITD